MGLLGACSSTKKKTAMEAPPPVEEDSSSMLNGDSDSGKAAGLQTVYFDFNSSALSSMAQDTLMANARILQEKGNLQIQIEGHCDERGGVQYNLALGESRAKATKDFLTSQGISSDRITTISFGKEKPLSFGHDEESWSRNRRSNFVITAN